MRAAALAALAFAGAVSAQTVTIDRWQDMGPLLDRQSKKINEHTAQVAALAAKVAALEAAKADAEAKVTTLTSDMGLVIQRYDTLLRAIVINVCASNKAMADNAWAAKLAGLQPIPLGDHACPPLPARYYVPGYLSPSGPPIPPATP